MDLANPLYERSAQSDHSIGEGVEETRQPLHSARHLPGYIYTSPEILALEKEKIFMRDWLCMGRVEEIENPGDYMTFRVLGEPLIIARNEKGEINAFANVCRHRGVEVASGSGNLKEFSCPYHGWTYDLEGQLIGAPYMKEAEGFDPTSCRLSPLKCDTWAGWIFVNFDPEPESLSDFTSDLEDDFGLLRQQDLRLAYKFTSEFDCNWKLFNENGMDVYHFSTLHADSFGEHIPVEEFRFDLKEGGGFTGHYNAAPTTFDGKSQFGPMPWMEDKPWYWARMGFKLPNWTFISRYDSVQGGTIWPTEPGKSQFVSYCLLPPAYFDQPGFREKVQVYEDFFNFFLDEDKSMVQAMQRNMDCRQFVPGRVSKLETSVFHLINGYLDRMFGPPE